MNDAPISFMNRDDIATMTRNYTQALDSLPDGHTCAWTNPKTGHSGTATPLRSMRAKGMACRLLELTNHADDQAGRSEFPFCRTKDGWRILV